MKIYSMFCCFFSYTVLYKKETNKRRGKYCVYGCVPGQCEPSIDTLLYEDEFSGGTLSSSYGFTSKLDAGCDLALHWVLWKDHILW